MSKEEKKQYRSGVLAEETPAEFAAVVVTRDGLEVEAAAEGFKLSLHQRWERLRAKGQLPERTAQPPEPEPKLEPVLPTQTELLRKTFDQSEN